MTSPPSEPGEGGPTQWVSGSTVARDLIQIAHVAGNVTIGQTEQQLAVAGQIVEGDIPQQPRGFQPREDLLERLHGQVAARGAAVVCALTGTPGVGKSLLAASYAWACQAAGWPVVAWISAESLDQIVAGMDALAGRLGIRAPDDDPHTGAGRARSWLSGSHRPSLLVFDNAADLDQVRTWCPATGATRVVITSRNRSFERLYAPVEVEMFTLAEALAFLRQRTGLDDGEGAAELAVELGCLPLALAQAAAYITRRRIGYRAYLELLCTSALAEHLPRQHGDPYPAGTAEAIMLSLEQAEATIENSWQLLGILAVLSPAGVPRQVLYGNADPAMIGVVDGMLADLADTCLISFSQDGSTVLTHRLVQRVLRERATCGGRLGATLSYAVNLLYRFNTTIPVGAKTWAARPAVEILIEQSTAAHAIACANGNLPAALLNLRVWCGLHLVDLVDLGRAIPLLEATRTDCEQALGVEHSETLNSYGNLAHAYETAGRVSEAIALLETALAIRVRVQGSEHPDTMTSRHNLASAYKSVGRLDKAIALHERARDDCVRVLGEDHPDTLRSRNNLANAYHSAGRLDEAIPLYERTLAQRERVLGSGHPETMTSRNNLASAYESAGQLDKAIALHERTLAEMEEALGSDHPNTLRSRGNLASAYVAAGRPEQAIALHKVTLAERERVLGSDHPDTLQSRHELAYAHQSAGQFDEAIALHKATLAERERVLGSEHPDTLQSRHNLASAYQSAGQYDEAAELYQATLTDCERVLSVDHPLTQAARNNLAAALQAARSKGRPEGGACSGDSPDDGLAPVR